MADQLYLSLWFPNFRLASLAPAILSVLKQFAAVGGSPRVHAAAAYPISWNEAAIYQRIYDPEETEESSPEAAVAEATRLLHDDFAYEFEIEWELWAAETGGGLDPLWRREARGVRVIGFGPQFDDSAYVENGQIRVDLGIDTPFLLDEVELDPAGADHIRQNVQQLVDFTCAVQDHCGISSRLLWSDSGESLAEKLIARLQRVN